MIDAIRPTLGPRPRNVAVNDALKSKIEILDDGGSIARRIISLPDRDADVGAMYLRHMLWRLHEDVGDGTATAAVIFQTIFNEGLRYITAGGNAQRIRHYLEQGMRLILDTLSTMTAPVEGKAELAKIAQTICYDPPMAAMLGEIFDIIGEYGRLELRAGRSRALEREYVEGMYWDGGLVSREMIADAKEQRTVFENAAVLISDLDIEEPQHMVPALFVALKTGARAILIIGQRFSDKAKGFMIANNDSEKMRIMAVKTPQYGQDQIDALQDLAALTGGRPFVRATGNTSLDDLKPQDLGRVRRAWADTRYFGVVGGKGDPRALRQHIADLRAAHRNASDPAVRQKLRQRLGKLMGGSATLWVGGVTERDIDLRKTFAARTAEALRGALTDGVIIGGGAALLSCRPALWAKLAESADTDEQAAYRMLIKAMETPARTLIANAGGDAGEVLAAVEMAGPGWGFDINTEQIVDMAQAGIFDVAAVQKAAVHSAIASAALALTVDVMVHHKKPETSTNP
ncbi:MAG: hypothetical protein JXB47_19515 [Anaerolineae bacterium]|nr:hypothetical protein [Anaerolineae bacterium]